MPLNGHISHGSLLLIIKRLPTFSMVVHIQSERLNQLIIGYTYHSLYTPKAFTKLIKHTAVGCRNHRMRNAPLPEVEASVFALNGFDCCLWV